MIPQTIKAKVGQYRENSVETVVVPTGLKWARNKNIGAGLHEGNYNYWTIVPIDKSEALYDDNVKYCYKINSYTFDGYAVLEINDFLDLDGVLEIVHPSEIISQFPELKNMLYVIFHACGQPLVSIRPWFATIREDDDPRNMPSSAISVVSTFTLKDTFEFLRVKNYDITENRPHDNLRVAYLYGDDADDMWRSFEKSFTEYHKSQGLHRHYPCVPRRLKDIFSDAFTEEIGLSLNDLLTESFMKFEESFSEKTAEYMKKQLNASMFI